MVLLSFAMACDLVGQNDTLDEVFDFSVIVLLEIIGMSCEGLNDTKETLVNIVVGMLVILDRDEAVFG